MSMTASDLIRRIEAARVKGRGVLAHATIICTPAERDAIVAALRLAEKHVRDDEVGDRTIGVSDAYLAARAALEG